MQYFDQSILLHEVFYSVHVNSYREGKGRDLDWLAIIHCMLFLNTLSSHFCRNMEM